MPQIPYRCEKCGKKQTRHHNAKKCLHCPGKLKQVVKPCNCIKLVERRLKTENTELDLCFVLDQVSGQLVSRMRIATKKVDSKKRTPPKTLLASYCPVCGKKIPD